MKPHCLLLDKRYYPFLIVDYKKAICLSFRESVKVLEYHMYEKLRTINNEYPCPIVMLVDDIVDLNNLYVNPTRKLIFLRDNYTCQYCGKPLSESAVTIDHVIPKSRGGVWSWYNLVTCCKECNQRKPDRTPEEVGFKLRNKPTRPEPFILTFRRLVRRVDKYTREVWLRYLPAKFRIEVKRL